MLSPIFCVYPSSRCTIWKTLELLRRYLISVLRFKFINIVILTEVKHSSWEFIYLEHSTEFPIYITVYNCKGPNHTKLVLHIIRVDLKCILKTLTSSICTPLERQIQFIHLSICHNFSVCAVIDWWLYFRWQLILDHNFEWLIIYF